MLAKATNFAKANRFARVDASRRNSRLPCASFVGTRLCSVGIDSCAHTERDTSNNTLPVRYVRYIRRYCLQTRVNWNAKDKEPVTSTFPSVRATHPPRVQAIHPQLVLPSYTLIRTLTIRNDTWKVSRLVYNLMKCLARYVARNSRARRSGALLSSGEWKMTTRGSGAAREARDQPSARNNSTGRFGNSVNSIPFAEEFLGCSNGRIFHAREPIPGPIEHQPPWLRVEAVRSR